MMRRSVMRWGLMGVVLLAAAAVAVLATTWPKTSGTLHLAGVKGAVTVTRDGHGIPRIQAENWDNAFFALGFVHAQDRFFQMELMRRAGAGRLSEMLGAATLDMDRYMRKLGLYRLAEAQATAASPALKKRLDAYAAGVNAWIEEATWPRTVEFLALRHAPEPWRPADSLVWGKLMAVRLAGNWRTERLRMDMLTKLSPEQVSFLWPSYPGDAPTAFPGMAGGSGLAAFPDMDWDPRRAGAPATASNAWAITGPRTPSGKPFLANDPHLEFQAPIMWYLARLDTPTGLLAGATVPGVPFLVIGHNGHVAWGFTTTGADTEDLIVETPAETPDTYRTDADNGTAEFAMREETIKVRDAAPQALKVMETPEGPVITEAVFGRPVTLSAPYLDPGDSTPDALLALNAARTRDDVAAALRLFQAPVQNVVYATKDGDIGMVTAGRIPKRKRGDGRVPLVRTQGVVGHAGYLDPSLLPRYANPPGGVLLNANNKVTPPGFPIDITADWPPPYRARRLADLLAGDRPDPAAPQMDIHSAGAEELMAFAFAQLDETLSRRSLVRLLERWNGAMDRRQRAPLAFMFFALNLKRSIFADELGGLIDRWHGLRIRAAVRAMTEGRQWCDDVATADRMETCADAVARALDQTARDLMGLDRELGRAAVWGDVHVARFDHPVFRHLPVLDDWSAVEVATDGGDDTLNRGAMWLGRTDAPFAHRHGAGLRALMDFRDLDAARFVIATGQSGNPLSARYRDMVDLWRDGGSVALGPLASGAGEVLKLLPKE